MTTTDERQQLRAKLATNPPLVTLRPVELRRLLDTLDTADALLQRGAQLIPAAQRADWDGVEDWLKASEGDTE